MKKLVLIIFITGLIASCGSGDKKAKLEKLKQQSSDLLEQIKKLEDEIALSGDTTISNIKTKDISIKPITFETFKHFIDVQGRVDGDENVTVSGKMAGAVDRILVNEGDEVSEGQVLAELDNSVFKQSLEELKNALAFASDVYEKQKNLWDQKIGTEIQFLSAKNNKESLEKKISTLKEQMELSKIKSPINGVVDGIDIKIGQSVMPGMPAIRVVNLNKLKAKAEISESYASKVKKGNDVVIFLPDLNKEIPSKIFYTSKVINNTTRTFSAEADLDSQNQDYRPNMIAVLKVVDYHKDSAIVVPLNLVQHSGTSEYVYIVGAKNGKEIAIRKDVTLGQIYNGKAEIITGLNLNDKLITSGYLDLTEGMLIKY
ncbi:MAG: efflux RND transporter periplasmic adaptor subunit [Sphingobacteriaceae bacterium]|nr:efflux RND transporter periplasmic adaptor subunit [Sphingobacteriaceae bacterium]